MTVLRSAAFFFALSLLFLVSGCGGGNGGVVGDETSDPLFRQAKDLEKQGRSGEALVTYLRLIDRRGENGAPESHLEAGSLYRKSSHDPLLAYYHFNKYLELRTVGPNTESVAGQRDAAKREFLTLMLGTSGDSAMRVMPGEDADALRQKVIELTAELQTLRGSRGGVPVRPAPVMALADEAPPRDAEPNITPAPTTSAVEEAAPTTQGRPTASQSAFVRNWNTPPAPTNRPVPTPAQTQSRPTTPAQVRPSAVPASATDRVVTTPTRPTAPQRPSAVASTGGRRHTVAAKDSLYSISRQYYGTANAAQVNAIFQANRDIMRSPGDLHAGMVLRIP